MPERILGPIARDAGRGWMVLPDGGCGWANGALSWDRAVRLQGEEEAGEFADAPLRALESLLSDSVIVAV
ncbi:MAG TPA: hypothetical protein VLA80_05975 [Actinomycetota bacterium]|nr:hypothetical protein [Actinomycetota bacterium]